MADLNPHAKRIYNVSPDPVRLTFEDGVTAVFQLGSVEFFQTELRGEGVRVGSDDALYRITTTDDDEHVIVGRKDAGEEGWTMVGRVTDVERAD